MSGKEYDNVVVAIRQGMVDHILAPRFSQRKDALEFCSITEFFALPVLSSETNRGTCKAHCGNLLALAVVIRSIVRARHSLLPTNAMQRRQSAQDRLAALPASVNPDVSDGSGSEKCYAQSFPCDLRMLLIAVLAACVGGTMQIMSMSRFRSYWTAHSGLVLEREHTRAVWRIHTADVFQ